MHPATFRLLRPTDSFPELTDLIHRAFAPLAERGMRYLGSYQDEAETRRRCGRGECWVAETEGRLVGTVTWRHDPIEGEPDLFLRKDVAVFGQMAVDPSMQRHRIGSRMLETVEDRAKSMGFSIMACDTAAPNTHLIAYYERRGYREAGRVQWPDANYESVLLIKNLLTSAPART